MAAVLVQIRGTMYDLLGRTSQQVLLQGEASLLGLEIGGGPIIPPPQPGQPPGIWGPNDPRPQPPIANVPGLPPMGPNWPPGGQPPGIWPGPGPLPHPEHPIVLPPEQVPPEQRPPEVPPPGTVTPVPPPPGSPGWPVSSMVPPPYVVLNYPGYGPVVVTAPPKVEPV